MRPAAHNRDESLFGIVFYFSFKYILTIFFCFAFSQIKYLTPATNSELRILNFHNILMIRIVFDEKNQKHYLKKTSSNLVKKFMKILIDSFEICFWIL